MLKEPVLTGRTVSDEMRKHFTEEPSRLERCGILLGGQETKDAGGLWVVTNFVEVPNSHEDPRNNFSMSREDVMSVLKFRGYVEQDIIGSVHTHPAGSTMDPSPLDVEEQPPGTLGCVLHVATKTLTYYTHEDGFIWKDSL